MTDTPPHPSSSSSSRKHRHSRESPFREEIVYFRNSAGNMLKGYLLSKWNDSPYSSPHHQKPNHSPYPLPVHPHPHAPPSALHFASTITTPSTSPPSNSSSPSASPPSVSPRTPSLLQSSLIIDAPTTSFSTPSSPSSHPSPPLPLSFPSLPSPPRCLLLCHGMAAHSQWGFLPSLAESLLREVPSVASVLRFDFTGCGGSEGEFEYGGYGRQVSDIGSAAAWMRGRGYAVWGLVGHSMGGNAVLLYAAEHHDVPHVVNLSARYRMTRGLPFGSDQLTALQESGFFYWRPKGTGMGEVKVTQSTINERLSLDMDAVRRITARVLTVHGVDDTAIPVEDAHSLAELIAHHTLRTLDDADHNYTTEQARLLMITTVSEWLSKASQPVTPHSPMRTVTNATPTHPPALLNGS